MAEYTAISVQGIAPGQNAVFTESPIPCNKGFVCHREGSGLFTLRGNCNQCKARYKVVFGGNIAIPSGGAAGPISVTLALDGEALQSAAAIVTPAAVNEYFNVFALAFIDVCRGCCATVTVENTSGQAILMQNANIVIERVG